MNPDPPDAPARDRVAIAYKEWAGVCLALAEGRQTVLLRKGGVAEGGFRPEYSEFWLFPTFVHQAEQGLKPGSSSVDPSPDGSVTIKALARIESATWLDRLDDCERVDEFHIWTPETITKRFQYRRPGLWLLAVRVWRRPSPWNVPFDPAHSGCKTWVPLEPAPDSLGMIPALTDEQAAEHTDAIRIALGPLTNREPTR